MAEGDDSTDESQKTEEPTARRLEEARKRGQVVFSREVVSWCLLFAATIVILGAGPSVMSQLRDTLLVFIEQPQNIPTDPHALMDFMEGIFLRIAGIIALPLLLLSVVAIGAGIMQTGILLTGEPLKPDLSKISIIAGAGRLFSMRSVVELIKGLFKLGIVSIAVYMALRPYFGSIDHFVGLDYGQSLFDLSVLFSKMMIAVLIVLFVIAAADYLYQREDFLKKMRMSKQELKDEFKQTEGDPHVKGQLRRLREQRARQRMMQNVPTADVVITNPTHYAVALKYDTAKMDAPVMVAKGADQVAQRIKEVARENKVPIVENPALARALFESMDMDEMIPQEQFKAVAEVISYVFKLKGKRS